MVTDAQRRGLYEEYVRSHGQEHADTLMELLPGVGWSDVARRSDVEGLAAKLEGLSTAVDGKLSLVDARIARAEARVVYANVGLAIGVAGLVLTAARFA